MGDNAMHNGLIKKQVAIKSIAEPIVNNNAFLLVIIPAGISLTAVRGFNASYFASNQRLNAMAALRAVTIQISTKTNFSSNSLIGCGAVKEYLPKKNPIIAKGNAKMV